MDKKCVLIVDDDEAILESLAGLFQTDDVIVEGASTLEEATKLLSAHAFDLVILDLRLSSGASLEGLDLLSLIKTKAPKTHVVLMTAYGAQEIEREAIRRGASSYFEKSIPISEFRNRLKALGISV